MIQPIYLHREFTAIVKSVSDILTLQLKQSDSAIQGVHYMFGHPLEIINTLSQMTGNTSAFKKYPLVAFFLDTTEEKGQYPGIYAEYNVHLAIIRECRDPNQNANERDLFNFIPVLTPIYMELLNQINLRGDLFLTGRETLPHRKTNRYYWGRSGLWGNEGNIFNDWVDCIEIENLRLRVNNTYCPKQVV